MARPLLAILGLCFALPACTLTASSDPVSAEVAQALTELRPGSRCRVTLREVDERMRSTSQLTYEGTVDAVSPDSVTLDAARIMATSRTPPPVKTNIPFVDRQFASESYIEQSLDEPVTIPVAKIERVSPLDAEGSTQAAER